MIMENLYTILEVSKSATLTEIKRSFRKLAVKFHPDKNEGDLSAKAKFQQINNAYSILKDPVERKKYDESQLPVKPKAYQSAHERGHKSDQFVQTDHGNYYYHFANFQETFKKNSEKNNLFEEMFGTKLDQEFDLKLELFISESEAITGCVKMIEFKKNLFCPSCASSFILDHYSCYQCNGRKLWEVNKKINVRVPENTKNLTYLRLKNQAHQTYSGYGDVYILININKSGLKPDREDLNVRICQEILLEEARKDQIISHKNEAGKKINFRIPAMSKNGSMFRIKDCGLVDEQTSEKGHLYVTLKIIFPTNPKRYEQELINQLK